MVLRMQEITLPLPENYGIGLILITRPWLLRIAHKTTSNLFIRITISTGEVALIGLGQRM